MAALTALPVLGGGLGFRDELSEPTFASTSRIDWVEVIADQFLPVGAVSLERLRSVREVFPCVPHCLNFSVGGSDDVDGVYLEQVAAIAQAVDAPWVSDHLAFTRGSGVDLGHLAPIEWSVESARRIAAKADRIASGVGRPFILENITYHFMVGQELSEAAFITEIMERCDAGMLLDLSNIVSNATNHGFDPYELVDRLPLERVVQLHLAGGRWVHDVYEDSHDSPVTEDVWRLAEHACAVARPRAAMVERDDHFPEDFEDLLGEVDRARALVEHSR